MKIQTQARLLIAGIVLVPLLLFLANIVTQRFYNVEEEIEPVSEEFYDLFNEYMNINNPESVTRFLSRTQRFGEITVFRSDYLVLYSTNSEFIPGSFADIESILSFLNEESQSYRSNHTFTSQNLEGSRVYVLMKRTPQPPRQRLPPFFISAIILIIILIVFVLSMSIVITRSITHSVEVLENATRRIAEGELNLNIDVKGSNEITSLTNSLNKMRSALKEDELRRSRFIMGISHDLKTPLALIKGYAEAIEDGVAEDPESLLSAAEIIITKSDQLESMINDLINYVRMDTGEWRTQLERVNLAAFLKNVLKPVSTDVELLHHTLSYDINLPENLSIPMDERLVLRAIENLINNAVRYSYPDSVIRFAAVLIENAVKITVSNDGQGIDKDDLPRVFEMLYRGSSSRREQGMGLGLAVVKWVADYHGWSVNAESAPSALGNGKETCFTITIPPA